MRFIDPIRTWYGRFERPISSISLVLGFVFDAITLKRVDTLWENFWIFGHLIIVAVFIILIHTQESEEGDETNPEKVHFWYVNILQFFFGGILSTYLVFYFRSADILVTWPFIILLALAFWANEALKRHYVRFSFQISLFFLSVYSFSIFLVPVVIHKIGPWAFILSGILSLIFIGLFIIILQRFIKREFKESKKLIFGSILGIFVVVNILYFTNLIPPIPLSLKDGGIYYSIQKNAEGDYLVEYEKSSWRNYFHLYPDFKEVSDRPIYAYSAVFSPSNLDISIIHEWQHYDETQKKWISGGQVKLPVVGGREEGFRTYSSSSGLESGRWRVNIETESGHLIGRLRFNVVKSDTRPVISTKIKK